MKYKSIISAMSLNEKARILSGKNMWETVGYEKHGIPEAFLSDGPHGLRKQAGKGDQLGIHGSIPATCFPTAAGIANTFDDTLGEEIGEALGEEARNLGVNVILGPGLNIKRSPLCGRNFEYFSEDPYLAGKMAAAYIRGIQKKGVGACPKHFAVNSQELRRMANDSIVDERTLREIYLTAFEIAVKEGKPHAIMSSYNAVNGTYAHENRHLLSEILRKEWGFTGAVVSDWGGCNDVVEGLKAGSNLEMPGNGRSTEREIVKAVKEGRLWEEVLDERVDELLGMIFATHFERTGKPIVQDVTGHNSLAKKAAEESAVLLKNVDNILPLKKGTKVAVIGDFAIKPRYQGAGSSLVNPTVAPDTLLSVFSESGKYEISFARGYKRNSATDPALLNAACSIAQKADVVLFVGGLDEVSESEGVDRNTLAIPEAQEDLMEELSKVNKNLVAVISAGSCIEMMWEGLCKGVLLTYLGGQASAEAVFELLSGKANPSGKLSESYPITLEDVPCYKYYPSPERNSEFREGIFVGYRYYATAGKKVSFPFGFGLSYTTFEYGNLTVSDDKAVFTIRNTGDVAGTEIAELYVSRKSDTVFRPARELKGYARVTLEPGEEKTVEIPFDDKTFRFFDIRKNKFEVEKGTYTIIVSSDSESTELSAELDVKGTVAEGSYDRKSFKKFFEGDVTSVSDAEFAMLYGAEIPDGHWTKNIRMNDAVCQLSYGRGLLGKFFAFILRKLIENSNKKNKPNLNALFNYNMTIRGYAKMTGGFVTMDMARALTEMANGRRIVGTFHLFKSMIVR